MSDCKNFTDMTEKILNEECSEKEKNLFYEHLSECDSCKEDFEFTQSIQNTLRTLPKIEVPNDFLASLNDKLDFEDKIKREAPVIKRKKFFSSWKKYSALTACLLLAVLLKVDIWDVHNMTKTDNATVEIAETIEVSEITPEVEIAPVIQEPVQTETIVDNTIASDALPTVLQEEQKPETKEQKKTSKQASSSKKVQKSKPAKSYEAVKPVEEAPILETAEEKPASKNKVLVMKASTPHSSVDIPAGPDDDIVMVDRVVPKRVKFDDYKMVESEELLEAFAISEVSDKTVIVATPAAMDAVSNLSFDSADTRCEVPNVNHGAGGGSFFVSVDDQQIVASILRKYSSGENNQTFMLSSKNYASFISELQRQGIEYTDYMINTGKSNVAFKLMAA